jgi:hypothetical protein
MAFHAPSSGRPPISEPKPGLDEKIYDRALVIELTSQGHVAERKEI